MSRTQQTRFVNLSKSFGDVPVLKDVSLDLGDGEFVVIVGPSGCGKSTLLRLVAGLETPTSGEFYLDGRLMNRVAPYERNIGMVFQNYALYPHMTVYKNLVFGLEAHHTRKSAMRERVTDVARLLEIDDILKMKPKTLSGGQRQRVALGRALIRRPRLFLLDEPLSNLDAQLRERMRVDIRRLHDQVGVTTLYVTHDQTEAMTMADRIVVLNQGRSEQIGEPSEVYRNPASRFVAGFIGAPSMNLVPVGVERTPRGWRLGLEGGSGMAITVPYGSAWDGALERHPEVWLGIRPERILLHRPDSAVRLELAFQASEVLGARSTLHTRWGGEPVTISVETEWGGEFGREMTAYAPIDSLHFFDRASGRRLSPSPVGATQIMAG